LEGKLTIDDLSSILYFDDIFSGWKLALVPQHDFSIHLIYLAKDED